MFDRLKQKWKVNAVQLTLILITFAIGGSLTGYAGRKLLDLFSIEQRWLWIVVYIIVICLLWPLAVLFVSILFGQYRFFIKYIKKIGSRMGLINRKSEVGSQKSEARKQRFNIAIFASGEGSNAQKIIEYFAASTPTLRSESDIYRQTPTLLLSEKGETKTPIIKISLIVSNNPNAGVLKIAEKHDISTMIIEKEKFFRGNAYVNELKEKQIDFIVLAGFMWKLPASLINAYHEKIINIHPALLPKYGGKGLYGNYVHEAVLADKEKESGITIHYVDDIYDHGKIIFQAKCAVIENDTVDSLKQRIHALEHEHYPRVIEEVVSQISQKSHTSH